jgi:hypothetical protein
VNRESARRFALLAITLPMAWGCTTQQVSSTSTSRDAGGLAPVLTVERFLQAASQRDLATMATLFGTHEGPLDGRREDLELRMNAIAVVLEHDDYSIGAETMVPGRTHPTRRVGVDLIRGETTYEDVPFLVVETRSGSWIVEEIGLDQITSQPRGGS